MTWISTFVIWYVVTLLTTDGQKIFNLKLDSTNVKTFKICMKLMKFQALWYVENNRFNYLRKHIREIKLQFEILLSLLLLTYVSNTSKEGLRLADEKYSRTRNCDHNFFAAVEPMNLMCQCHMSFYYPSSGCSFCLDEGEFFSLKVWIFTWFLDLLLKINWRSCERAAESE